MLQYGPTISGLHPVQVPVILSQPPIQSSEQGYWQFRPKNPCLHALHSPLSRSQCDSIHSVIERAINRKPIYSPQNYADKIREARPKQPYEVEFLTHEVFKEYSKLKYYNSIRPGTRTGEPVVTDLRVIRYNPDGVIEYKLNYGDEFSPLPRRAKIGEPSPLDEVPQLHEDPLPIKKKKYGHLQELKVVIPKDYHTFYDNLPHEN
ncbi:hypothetical protein SNE40_011899 [Patella caerulea]|uniref:Uncharacterized protein n=1 Tax=Patella caerulea TaxID=87958 RepID=A0AAN8JMD7_PATCE